VKRKHDFGASPCRRFSRLSCRTKRRSAVTFDPRETDALDLPDDTRGALVDQSVVLALRGRQFVYHTAPFERDTEVSGFFKLTLWLAIDCPDTDFYVVIQEIARDGSCLQLSTDTLRARYREGLRTPKLITTRAPLRYDFERFAFTSRQIPRSHRLRLVIASTSLLIERTLAQRNYNTGGVVADESIADARAVTIRLHHEASCPSALEVPIARTPILNAPNL
jgi:predicted acyl esterase